MTIRTGSKGTGCYLMLFAAMCVGAYPLMQGIAPALRGGFVGSMVLMMPGSAVLHFLGGSGVCCRGVAGYGDTEGFLARA